jgi:DNA repair protein RecN (Recombination protein N)
MLQSLRIRNLALLERIELDFEAGFTAVTGETGAGKSILLGALGLLAGERADKALIRQGAEACEVEAALYFADPRKIDAVIAELGLPASEEGVIILKRGLHRDKPPKVTVNGGLATLAALQRLGEHWVDFHGPSEPRRLLHERCQLELLDLYGRAGETLAVYREKYDAWRGLRAERDRLAGEARLPPDQVEFLRHQLAQMDALELTPEAIEALEREFQRMSRSQELIALADALADGLTGDDGVQGRLGALLREARRLAGLDPASAALAGRLEAAAVELADLGAEFSGLGRQLQFDPEHAELLAGRMNAWLDVKRRHGGALPAVIAARDSLRLRLAAQGDLAGSLERIDRDIEAAEGAARREAAKLGRLREKAARELEEVAARDIGRLGFKQAEFQVRILAHGDLGPAGDCGCEFLFSPNVGEAPLPLGRIASSGELARVMLALKAVLADLDDVPLLVFDEVDANVGGEIGGVVGERMAAIARRHQVLCVTHLPQVAAHATCHLVVTKDQSGDRAVVGIAPIQASRRARVGELARMLGDRDARSARAHAEELLAKGAGGSSGRS